MKRPLLPLLALIAASILTAGLLVAEEATTLEGEFVWNARGSAGDLEAVFTPTGEDTWNVDFHFEFRGSAHTYSGSAEGSLSEGALKGEVQNENKERNFTFEGKFNDGEFNGRHSEIKGGRAQSTGSLTLSAG